MMKKSFNLKLSRATLMVSVALHAKTAANVRLKLPVNAKTVITPVRTQMETVSLVEIVNTMNQL